MKRMIKKVVLALAVLAFAAPAVQSCSSGNAPVAALEIPLDVYFLKAGKADAIVIATENSSVLIDTGLDGYGGEISSFLASKGIESLDYLIITHFDKDHVGGAAEVVRSVRVENVIESNYPKNSSEYKSYKEALTEAGITPLVPKEDLKFTLDGVEFTVNPPAREFYNDDPSNNSSLIVKTVCGSKSLLFMGDAERDRIDEFIKTDVAGGTDLIKMPHHGKWDSHLRTLISAVNPKYAVITSSDDKPESEKTTALLKEKGIAVYLTRTGCFAVSLRDGAFEISYDN